jgi:hypothetical protein
MNGIYLAIFDRNETTIKKRTAVFLFSFLLSGVVAISRTGNNAFT